MLSLGLMQGAEWRLSDCDRARADTLPWYLDEERTYVDEIWAIRENRGSMCCSL